MVNRAPASLHESRSERPAAQLGAIRCRRVANLTVSV